MGSRLGVRIGVLFALSGCAGPFLDATWPEPAPLGRETGAAGPARAARERDGRPRIVEPTGPLELRRALELAAANNPELAAASWKVRAAEARQMQAGVGPNPEAELEVEEFGGSGAASGFGASTATFAVGREIETAGKRAKRTRAAGLQRRLAAWDHEAVRLDVFTETTVAFVAVLAAQEEVALTEDAVTLAERTLTAVSERVEAGKVSPLEAMQAEVALSTSRVELGRTRRKLRAARESLAGTWGSSPPAFEKAVGDLEEVRDVPPLSRLLDIARCNPDVARWRDEIGLREARLDLESANRAPNLEVSAGVQRLAEAGETAFVVGVAVPLPIFDRNRGGILAAERELAGAREERRAAEVEVTTALRRSYHELSSAREEALSLREKVLPAARRTFDAVQEGYRQGKLGYLQVIDSQRVLSRTRGQYIDALAAFRTAVAEVERLTGARLDHVGRPGIPAAKED